MSKTESEVPPLARKATVPVSVAKQECPSRCRKLNLRHLHWRETPRYLSLLPSRNVRKACEQNRADVIPTLRDVLERSVVESAGLDWRVQ